MFGSSVFRTIVRGGESDLKPAFEFTLQPTRAAAIVKRRYVEEFENCKVKYCIKMKPLRITSQRYN